MCLGGHSVCRGRSKQDVVVDKMRRLDSFVKPWRAECDSLSKSTVPVAIPSSISVFFLD
jgi:hypothetical protein